MGGGGEEDRASSDDSEVPRCQLCSPSRLKPGCRTRAQVVKALQATFSCMSMNFLKTMGVPNAMPDTR